MCRIDASERMKNVINHANDVVRKYPSLKDEVEELLNLCECEIEQGGSAEHEISLCWNDIDYLVENLN